MGSLPVVGAERHHATHARSDGAEVAVEGEANEVVPEALLPGPVVGDDVEGTFGEEVEHAPRPPFRVISPRSSPWRAHQPIAATTAWRRAHRWWSLREVAFVQPRTLVAAAFLGERRLHGVAAS